MGIESKGNRFKDPFMLAQVTLAQMAFGEGDHNAAMRKWLDGGDDSFAAHFSIYVAEHPDALSNIEDEGAMRKLLEEVRTYH